MTATATAKTKATRVKPAKAEDCIVHEDGRAIITLSRPTMVNGVEVTSVTMREPTVRDQRAAQAHKDPVDVETHAMCNLCDMSPDDIEALPLRDFRRLQVAYMGFID